MEGHLSWPWTGCCVSPPIVVPGASNAVSLKLSGPALLPLAGKPVRLVAMHKEQLVFDLSYTCREGTGCIRFDLPLADMPAGSIINIHVLVLLDGRETPTMAHVVQLPALPADAAAEVISLLETMTLQIDRFFRAAYSTHKSPLSPHGGSLEWLSRAGMPADAPSGAQAAAAATPIHPAVCYAYDHYFQPFLHAWVQLMQIPGDDSPMSQQQPSADSKQPTPAIGGTQSHASLAATQQLLNTFRSMLDYLLDYDMFSCAVLLINRQPHLAHMSLSLGLEVSDCLPQVLATLTHAARRCSSSGDAGAGAGAGPAGAGHGSAADSERRSDSSESGSTGTILQKLRERHPTGCTPAVSASGFCEGRDAEQQLVGLRLPQHAAGAVGAAAPSEYLGALQGVQLMEELDVRFTGELTLTRVLGRHVATMANSPGDMAGSYRCQHLQQAAPSQPLPPPAPPSSSRSGEHGGQPRPTLAADPALALAPMPLGVPSSTLLQAALRGFAVRETESAYALFKSMRSQLIDTLFVTYILVMTLCLLYKSLGRPLEIATVCTYAVIYTLPYALAAVNRNAFLQWREVVLTASRAACSLLVCLVYLALPQWGPSIWSHAASSRYSVHVSHGLLLPICQRVRFWYALLAKAPQLLSDFVVIHAGRPAGTPWRQAMFESAMIQLLDLLLNIIDDVFSRHVFVQQVRAQGVVAGDAGAGARAAAKQPASSTAASRVRRAFKVD